MEPWGALGIRRIEEYRFQHDMGVRNIRGTLLRVLIKRIIVFWGPPIVGNYHIIPVGDHLNRRVQCSEVFKLRVPWLAS